MAPLFAGEALALEAAFTLALREALASPRAVQELCVVVLRRHQSAYRAAAASDAATSDAAASDAAASDAAADAAFSLAYSSSTAQVARCISAAAAAVGKVVLKYACKSISHRKSSSCAPHTQPVSERGRGRRWVNASGEDTGHYSRSSW